MAVDLDKYAKTVELILDGKTYKVARATYKDSMEISEITQKELDGDKLKKDPNAVPNMMIDFVTKKFKAVDPGFTKGILMQQVPEVVFLAFKSIVQGEGDENPLERIVQGDTKN